MLPFFVLDSKNHFQWLFCTRPTKFSLFIFLFYAAESSLYWEFVSRKFPHFSRFNLKAFISSFFSWFIQCWSHRILDLMSLGCSPKQVTICVNFIKLFEQNPFRLRLVRFRGRLLWLSQHGLRFDLIMMTITNLFATHIYFHVLISSLGTLGSGNSYLCM